MYEVLNRTNCKLNAQLRTLRCVALRCVASYCSNATQRAAQRMWTRPFSCRSSLAKFITHRGVLTDTDVYYTGCSRK